MKDSIVPIIVIFIALAGVETLMPGTISQVKEVIVEGLSRLLALL